MAGHKWRVCDGNALYLTQTHHDDMNRHTTISRDIWRGWTPLVSDELFLHLITKFLHERSHAVGKFLKKLKALLYEKNQKCQSTTLLIVHAKLNGLEVLRGSDFVQSPGHLSTQLLALPALPCYGGASMKMMMRPSCSVLLVVYNVIKLAAPVVANAKFIPLAYTGSQCVKQQDAKLRWWCFL